MAVTASVDYAAATFLNCTLSFYGLNFVMSFGTTSVQAALHHTFVLFVIILAAQALINIFSSHLVALFTNISVWWARDRSDSMYWLYVLPLGFC